MHADDSREISGNRTKQDNNRETHHVVPHTLLSTFLVPWNATDPVVGRPFLSAPGQQHTGFSRSDRRNSRKSLAIFARIPTILARKALEARAIHM